MWLPKDEKSVLRYLYTKIPRGDVGNTVKLQLEEFARCCFDKDRAVSAARFLAENGLLKLDTINHPSNYIMLAFTPSGYDLSRKYSSKYHTFLLWCNEYKLWVILTVIITLIGLLVAIFKG